MVLYSARSRNAISWSRLRQEYLRPQLRLSIRCFGVDHTVPFRKQLKDEAKRRAAGDEAARQKHAGNVLDLDRWELTVGIEIHAQLNSDRKLFSSE